MTIGQRLRGVFCPLMVPLDEAGRIHEAELRRLVDWLIARGIHGLFPNGSCSEFPLFTPEERTAIVRIVVEQAAGRVVVMAGATEATAALSVLACERYAELGADCVVIVPPSYYRLSQAGVTEHYRYIAERSPLGVVLYNIPQFANEIALETVLQLAELPNIVGLKDSSAALPRFLRTLAQVGPRRPDFGLMIGSDDLFAPALLMGAHGGTLSTSGVAPEAMVAIYEAAAGAQVARAVALQLASLELIRVATASSDFPDAMRAAMTCRGFAMGPSRTPRGATELAGLEQTQALVTAELSRLAGVVNLI